MTERQETLAKAKINAAEARMEYQSAARKLELTTAKLKADHALQLLELRRELEAKRAWMLRAEASLEKADADAERGFDK